MKQYWYLSSVLVRLIMALFAIANSLTFPHLATSILLCVGAAGVLLSLIPAVQPKRCIALASVSLVMLTYLLRASLFRAGDILYFALLVTTYLLTVGLLYVVLGDLINRF